MNTTELARAIGHLEADVAALKNTARSIESKVDALVKADVLAKGGKKMLFKVGALCSTLGSGITVVAEFAAKHLS